MLPLLPRLTREERHLKGRSDNRSTDGQLLDALAFSF